MFKLQRILREKDAATAVEYAVMLAMILLLCIGAVAMVGQQARSMWGDNETGLKSAFTP
jgi:pilus assembly protein Flp/PilA